MVVVRALADRCVPLRQEIDGGGRARARELGVDAPPTTVFLSPDGRELGRILGYVPPTAFVERVEKILADTGVQAELSKALHSNLYQIDIFLSEADTLIAKNKFRLNLCSHDAYGIDTVRNPLWSVYWYVERHDKVVEEFKRVGFRSGDTVGIDIDVDDKPTVYRL